MVSLYHMIIHLWMCVIRLSSLVRKPTHIARSWPKYSWIYPRCHALLSLKLCLTSHIQTGFSTLQFLAPLWSVLMALWQILRADPEPLYTHLKPLCLAVLIQYEIIQSWIYGLFSTLKKACKESHIWGAIWQKIDLKSCHPSKNTSVRHK